MIDRDSSLGGFLRRCRHGAGLTQAELAERARLSVEAINTLERGTRRQARPETLRRIADALGLGESERDHLFALVRGSAPAIPLGRRADAPPDASAQVHRLARAPIPPTTFIGREQELASIRAAVEDASVHLLTLIGPGGIGKTRLAFRVAEQVEAAFADGVFFVSLATVSDPTLVTWAIARAVGVSEYGTEPLQVTLASALHDRHVLLVLDNLEHLLESAPDIAALVQACPRSTILVTSRVVLNVAAERVIPIRPLSLPPQCTASRSPGFVHSDAIDFFTQRARETVPGFSLTDSNAPAVMELCSRLDCLPLALELAAARLRVLPLPALVERLDRKLDLLRGGPVDGPARHQDLRGAIAWSYDLLDADVQRLFAQLSVFTGGFTLDAAEAVCRSDAALVLDAVAALMDNSLLFHDAGDEWRYFTLETIRDYANERLERSGEARILRRNLALYLARFGEKADVELTGPQQARWLQAVEAEHDNFRSALRWAIDEQEVHLADQLGATLKHFWHRRGYISEARWWLEQIVALPNPEVTTFRMQTLAALGAFAGMQSDFDRSMDAYLVALRHADMLDEVAWAATILGDLGLTSLLRGDEESASHYLERSNCISRSVGEHRTLALSLANLAQLRLLQDDPDAARALLTESLSLHREVGDSAYVSETLTQIARLDLDAHNIPQALNRLQEALWVAHDQRFDIATASALEAFSVVYGQFGDLVRAARLAGAASSARAAAGMNVREPDAGWWDRHRTALSHSLPEPRWQCAWSEGQELSIEEAVALASAEDRIVELMVRDHHVG